MRLSKLISNQIGFRPVTSTKTPLLGITNYPNLSIGTGTYRNGVVTAPLAAKYISQEILSGIQAEKNPYSPASINGKIQQTPLQELLKSGSRELISMIHEPYGQLPYGRHQELQQLIYKLLILATSNTDETGMREHIKSELKKTNLPETMNRLYYDIIDMETGEAVASSLDRLA